MSALLKEPLLKMRPMQQQDISSVFAIEKLVYPFPWTLGIFKDCLKVGYCCWVLTLDEKIIGYGVLSVALDECHLLNVCIHPDWQGRGLGRKMTLHLLNLGRQHKAKTAFLEVRESNHQARSLYAKLRFVEVGRRKDYYPDSNGREDALVLSVSL